MRKRLVIYPKGTSELQAWEALLLTRNFDARLRHEYVEDRTGTIIDKILLIDKEYGPVDLPISEERN